MEPHRPRSYSHPNQASIGTNHYLKYRKTHPENFGPVGDVRNADHHDDVSADHRDDSLNHPNDVTAKQTDDPVDVPRAIPDGGWGWAVVAASFVVHIIADGIVYSFGIFFVEFLEYFGGTRGATAWIGSLLPGITLASGPIASALTNKYGCRAVTISGAIIATCGFIISMFGTNLVYLYFSFGIISGFGFGLIYLPAIVCVTQYFEKRRAFATGLAVCGSGIGTFIFAPFSRWLIEVFSWKGAILIEAGVVLNCVLCGALFRPLPFLSLTSDEVDTNEEHTDGDKEHDNMINNDHDSTNLVKFINNSQVNSIKSNAQFEMSKSTDGIGHIKKDHMIESLIRKETRPISSSELTVPQIHYGADHRHHPHRDHGSHQTLNSGIMYRKDIFYSGSIYNIAAYQSNATVHSGNIQSVDTDEIDSPPKRCCGVSPEISGVLTRMLDLSLLKDPIFLMFVISNFLTSIGFNVPFIYIPDRAVSLGIDGDRAAFLISIIGIANTVGRILFGWLADRPWVNRLTLYNTSLVICGVGTALSPLANTFETLAIYACVFGMFIGVYVSLTSVVLVDLLGLDKLTNSFGLLLLFQGVATFIGPPMAGWLYDYTGSYDVSFIVVGILIGLSGAMLYAIPFVRRAMKRNQSRDVDLEI